MVKAILIGSSYEKRPLYVLKVPQAVFLAMIFSNDVIVIVILYKRQSHPHHLIK